MGEIRLFHQVYGRVFPLESNSFPLEEPLHEQIEKHLLEYLGVCFLDHEVVIGASELDSDEEGRIDTLGIDTEGRPVIIEYKRDKKQDVVQQVLDYRDWLLKNRPMFRELVRETDQDCTDKVVWQPRLIVIAGEITQKNLREAKRNKDNTIIELVCYRRFGDEFLTLEWVYGESKLSRPKPDVAPEPPPEPTPTEPVGDNGKPFSINWDWLRANEDMRALFHEMHGFAKSLGSDVHLDAFPSVFSLKRVTDGRKRSPVIAFLHLRTKKSAVTLSISSTPPGVARQYHDAIVQNRADLEKAKPLLRKAYELYQP